MVSGRPCSGGNFGAWSAQQAAIGVCAAVSRRACAAPGAGAGERTSRRIPEQTQHASRKTPLFRLDQRAVRDPTDRPLVGTNRIRSDSLASQETVAMRGPARSKARVMEREMAVRGGVAGAVR